MQIGGRLLIANDVVDGPLPLIGKNREQQTDRSYVLQSSLADVRLCCVCALDQAVQNCANSFC